MSPETELQQDIARYSRDPVNFVRYAFPWAEVDTTLETHDGPYQWQLDVLSLIGEHFRGPGWAQPLRVAVASGRGIGKSALIAMICNWALSTCEDCRITVTANTESQLAVKTWPEISKWFRMAVNKHWWVPTATKICVKNKDHADIWRMDRETWSENNVDAFRGMHNAGKRQVVIYDEASGIPTPIWNATEGSLTDADTEMLWIAFSNPSQNEGSFRECFGKFGHRWKTFQIDSRKVPGTNLEEINQQVADYGEDSDYVRVNVRGEFPRAGSSQFISSEVVSEARRRVVSDQERAYKILSVDVARFGDDQTVIGIRQGLKLTILEKLRGLDTTQVAMRTMMFMRQLEPRSCVIDGDGIGGGVLDYIRLHGADWMEKRKAYFRLEEFHGGATPGDGFMYFNRRAEAWGMMRDWLETADIPDDPELADDLIIPQYFFSNKNQIQLERKEDMKKRGFRSPDCGDMLAMSMSVRPIPKTYEEALIEQIERVELTDPMEAHFMRLRETERLGKAKTPMQYWE